MTNCCCAELVVDEGQQIELSVGSDGGIEVGVAEQFVIGAGGNYQDKTVNITPSESAQSQTVRADVGYDALDEVEVNVAAIADDYVGSAVPRRASSSLSASGATVTAPAGYYSNQASKSVQSGTEGTPSATKGAVSNHSVEVTPSVTNTEGYISGGTKTGTPVSVSASELVSGTKSITSNGESDVTNYEKVNVAVPAGSPTLQNKTVHPSSSDQSITADAGYDGLGTVTAKAVTMTNLTAANIVSGVTVEVGDADDSDRVASVTGTASGSGYDTGTYTPANRSATIVFDIGLTTIHGVLIVPTLDTPLKSGGRTLCAYFGQTSASIYRSVTLPSNQSGSSAQSWHVSSSLEFSLSGNTLTVSINSPNNYGYFETISYTWIVW